MINILRYAFRILGIQFYFELTTLKDNYIAIYVAQIVVTNVAFTRFSLQCVIVSQQFHKHLYMTSCLNEQNHSTYTHLHQTGCTARDIAFFITYQDRQTQGLACDAITITTIIYSCPVFQHGHNLLPAPNPRFRA